MFDPSHHRIFTAKTAMNAKNIATDIAFKTDRDISPAGAGIVTQASSATQTKTNAYVTFVSESKNGRVGRARSIAVMLCDDHGDLWSATALTSLNSDQKNPPLRSAAMGQNCGVRCDFLCDGHRDLSGLCGENAMVRWVNFAVATAMSLAHLAPLR